MIDPTLSGHEHAVVADYDSPWKTVLERYARDRSADPRRAPGSVGTMGATGPGRAMLGRCVPGDG